ncbi:MAG: hypothetical protein ACKO4L_10500 [Nodosilinea sp.]
MIERSPNPPDPNTSQTASPPDLSVSQIDFTLLKRSSSFAGQVQILAGR